MIEIVLALALSAALVALPWWLAVLDDAETVREGAR